MDRRSYLSLAGITMVSLSGCLTEDTPDDESRTETPSATPSNTDTPSLKETFDPTEHVDDWQDERARGQADPITTDGTVDSGNVMEVKCGRVGMHGLRSYVDEQLGEPKGLAFSFGTDSKADHGDIFAVTRRLVVESDGSILGTPEVSFETLVSATPRTITATARYEEKEYTCQHPAFVRDSVIFQ